MDTTSGRLAHTRGAPADGPALDPELASVLAATPALHVPVLPENLARVRAASVITPAGDGDLRTDGLVVEHDEVAGRHGASLPLVLLKPATGDGRALVVYLHGGGLVAGDHRTGLSLLGEWVTREQVVVASVGYRLAPEHRYPTPVEDCYAALCSLSGRRSELGLADRPVIVAGSSAGGGLAAAVTLMARDRSGPDLAGQILMSAMLDDRMRTPSSYELDGHGVWDRRSNTTGWDAYLGDDRGADSVPAYAAPARCQDLAGLPPSYLDVGSAEIFRDEVIDYAARLARAGGSVELHVWPGAFHGFDFLAPGSGLAVATAAARLAYVARVLSSAA
jgi:acetyl esterase/lipase